MIAIIDYGVGNLFSLKSSFAAIGVEAVVSNNPDEIRSADRLILPGVGAFSDAADKLKKSGLDIVLKEEVAKGKPLMGICLGMQLLFEKSFEFGEYEGLGLIPGDIVPFKGKISDEYRIPQIGWNSLKINGDCPLYKGIKNGDYVYFVHSYYADCDDKYKSAVSEYGIEFTASVMKGNIFGCQFHPEKSGDVGLNILKAFCEL
jgi:glutamine amidotransferase